MKSVEKFQSLVLAVNKNIEQFTQTPRYIYTVDSCMKYFVAQQKFKVNPLVHYNGNTQQLQNVGSNMQLNNTKETHRCISMATFSILYY
jgi:hypothetical protein